MLSVRVIILCLALGAGSAMVGAAAPIERIWLSHASADNTRIVICWETAGPGESIVEFGATPALGQSVRQAGPTQLHQVEIPLPATHGPWHYRVRSGHSASPILTARGLEKDAFRAVVVGNLGYVKADWPAAVLREAPHLLLSAGDNVPQLHQGKRVADDDITAFRRLIDRAPELFRTTPFMPVLGNHDREVRPRGPQPPEDPVYDISATAFRRFFALPGDEWKWAFDVPAFDLRFIAVDLNHISDLGTTWQSCHDFTEGSEQLEWYRRTIAASRQPFLITLYNERHGAVRGTARGAWWPSLAQNNALITGFGYYAERAMVKGLPCINTSVSGRGHRYPDSASVFIESEDNYVLLAFAPGRKARIELRSLEGRTLDAIEVDRR
jgi:hypothetical protein